MNPLNKLVVASLVPKPLKRRGSDEGLWQYPWRPGSCWPSSSLWWAGASS